MAALTTLSRGKQDDLRDSALNLAALTLAIEVGARLGRSKDELRSLIQAAAEPETQVAWASELLMEAKACLVDPGNAQGIWKEALSVIHPLGMDLS